MTTFVCRFERALEVLLHDPDTKSSLVGYGHAELYKLLQAPVLRIGEYLTFVAQLPSSATTKALLHRIISLKVRWMSGCILALSQTLYRTHSRHCLSSTTTQSCCARSSSVSQVPTLQSPKDADPFSEKTTLRNSRVARAKASASFCSATCSYTRAAA